MAREEKRTEERPADQTTVGPSSLTECARPDSCNIPCALARQESVDHRCPPFSLRSRMCRAGLTHQAKWSGSAECEQTALDSCDAPQADCSSDEPHGARVRGRRAILQGLCVAARAAAAEILDHLPGAGG